MTALYIQTVVASHTTDPVHRIKGGMPPNDAHTDQSCGFCFAKNDATAPAHIDRSSPARSSRRGTANRPLFPFSKCVGWSLSARPSGRCVLLRWWGAARAPSSGAVAGAAGLVLHWFPSGALDSHPVFPPQAASGRRCLLMRDAMRCNACCGARVVEDVPYGMSCHRAARGWGGAAQAPPSTPQPRAVLRTGEGGEVREGNCIENSVAVGSSGDHGGPGSIGRALGTNNTGSVSTGLACSQVREGGFGPPAPPPNGTQAAHESRNVFLGILRKKKFQKIPKKFQKFRKTSRTSAVIPQKQERFLSSAPKCQCPRDKGNFTLASGDRPGNLIQAALGTKRLKQT